MANTILIVEDESITASDLKSALKDLGYDVVGVVDNGQEAIDSAAELCPDLVIMGIVLKGNIDGIDAAGKILELNIPIIYLTANSDESTFNKALENSSAYAFISKPFNKDLIKHNVEFAINRSKIEAEKINLAHGFVEKSFRENNLSEDIIDEIAKNEFSSLDKFKKFNSNPNVCILSKNNVIIDKIKSVIEDLDYNLVDTFSISEDAINAIYKVKIDLLFIDINLNEKTLNTFYKDLNIKLDDEAKSNIGYSFSSLNIPLIYILNDSVDLDSNKYLSTNYGFIWENSSPQEINFAIRIVLKNFSSNVKSVKSVESKFKEKNIELGIEKLYSILLLIISIVLIIGGIISRNVTFLQWIIFIPSIIMLFLAIVSLFKQREVIPYDENPFVSVFIPAHNEEYTIEDTVRSIANMEYYDLNGNKNFELIVVNDGSSDRTGEILSSLKSCIDNLRIITRKPPKSGKGKGFVLNDALILAHGSIIGVFDADTRVCPDFLTLLVPYLNNPKVDGVQSRVRMYNKDYNFLANMQDVEFSGFGNILRAKDNLGFNGFLGGNGQFVKKDAIVDAGKWDGFAVTEDLNLSIKLLLNGSGIRFCHEVSVYQEAVTNWDDFLRQRVRWAIGNFESLFIYSSRIIFSKLSILKKIGIISHISFYAFNLFIFIGFVIFLVNIIAWFILSIPTVIRMEAPLVIGIISAIAFFPGIAISLFRDDKRYLLFLKDLIYYWIYCFHLIPLFFRTMYVMITRKERRWDKTTHKGTSEEKG